MRPWRLCALLLLAQALIFTFVFFSRSDDGLSVSIAEVITEPEEPEESEDNYKSIQLHFKRKELVEYIAPGYKGGRSDQGCHQFHNQSFCSPSFIIAGVLKGGTTSVYKYLLQHPDVTGVDTELRKNETHMDRSYEQIMRVIGDKEVHFFPPKYDKLAGATDIDTALHEYSLLFKPIPPPLSAPFTGNWSYSERYRGKISGEASPGYILMNSAPVYLERFLPHVKFIFLLRHPVDRSVSEYFYRWTTANFQSSLNLTELTRLLETNARDEIAHMRRCWPKRDYDEFLSCMQSFKTCLRAAGFNAQDTFCSTTRRLLDYYRRNPRPLFLGDRSDTTSKAPVQRIFDIVTGFFYRSIYIYQLLPWLDIIPRDRMLFVASERLFRQPNEVMSEVAHFLGIRPIDWSPITRYVYNFDRIIGEDRLTIARMNASQAGDYPKINATLYRELLDAFRPYNRLLEHHLNMTMGWDD